MSVKGAAVVALSLLSAGGVLPGTLPRAAGAAEAEPQAQPPRRDVTWNNPDGPAVPGVEHGVLRSKAMGREVGYNVYLPPGYKDGKERYPVLYFLHGAGGSENSDAGGFSGLVRKEIEAKTIPPAICVFPNGGMSGYADRPEGKIMV